MHANTGQFKVLTCFYSGTFSPKAENDWFMHFCSTGPWHLISVRRKEGEHPLITNVPNNQEGHLIPSDRKAPDRYNSSTPTSQPEQLILQSLRRYGHLRADPLAQAPTLGATEHR